MPEMGALLFATQAMAAPGELLNLSLNATAVLPEAAVLFAMIATLLVDLAGEQVAARWVPPICYLGLGGSLLLLALQWNGPLEPAFLGAFLADNLEVAFRAVIARSTLLSLLISWRYAEQSGTPVEEGRHPSGCHARGNAALRHRSGECVHLLETLSVASYPLSGYMKWDAEARSGPQIPVVGSAAAAVFLYGQPCAGLSGSTSLETIGVALQTSTSPLAALALVFVLATVASRSPQSRSTSDSHVCGSQRRWFLLSVDQRPRLRPGPATWWLFRCVRWRWKLLFTVLAVLSMTATLWPWLDIDGGRWLAPSAWSAWSAAPRTVSQQWCRTWPPTCS